MVRGFEAFTEAMNQFGQVVHRQTTILEQIAENTKSRVKLQK
jgi:hypothetical protein